MSHTRRKLKSPYFANRHMNIMDDTIVSITHQHGTGHTGNLGSDEMAMIASHDTRNRIHHMHIAKLSQFIAFHRLKHITASVLGYTQNINLDHYSGSHRF